MCRYKAISIMLQKFQTAFFSKSMRKIRLKVRQAIDGLKSNTIRLVQFSPIHLTQKRAIDKKCKNQNVFWQIGFALTSLSFNRYGPKWSNDLVNDGVPQPLNSKTPKMIECGALIIKQAGSSKALSATQLPEPHMQSFFQFWQYTALQIAHQPWYCLTELLWRLRVF